MVALYNVMDHTVMGKVQKLRETCKRAKIIIDTLCSGSYSHARARCGNTGAPVEMER